MANYGAGEVLRGMNEAIVAAFTSQDPEKVKEIREDILAVRELAGILRKNFDTLYDTTTTVAVPEFLAEVERMVKIDPDNPRGRKPKEKVDPFTKV